MLIDNPSSRLLVIIQLLIKKQRNLEKKLFFCLRTRGEETRSRETVVIPAKRAKGSVGEGETGKKAKATQYAGGQSVSEKSQVTRTSKNLFEKSGSRFSDNGILQ